MARRTITGSLVMGATAAVAGYIWVAFEFPFAILLPAVLGMFVVTWSTYGRKRSALASIVGGTAFTAAFLVAVFFALSDGSPFALPAWAGALVAAVVAGAVTGALLEGRRGALTMAGFSAVGMLVSVTIVALMRYLAPASVDIQGAAQTMYFSAAIAFVGVVMGGFIGAAVERVHREPSGRERLHHSGHGVAG